MDKFADDKIKLFDIVTSIEEITGYIAGIKFETFVKETQIKDEVLYLLREIGNSVKLLSDEFKMTYGDIDWDVLKNLRFATWDQELEIEPNAIWYIIENDLPIIQDQINNITSVLEDKGGKFYY